MEGSRLNRGANEQQIHLPWASFKGQSNHFFHYSIISLKKLKLLFFFFNCCLHLKELNGIPSRNITGYYHRDMTSGRAFLISHMVSAVRSSAHRKKKETSILATPSNHAWCLRVVKMISPLRVGKDKKQHLNTASSNKHPIMC